MLIETSEIGNSDISFYFIDPCWNCLRDEELLTHLMTLKEWRCRISIELAIECRALYLRSFSTLQSLENKE